MWNLDDRKYPRSWAEMSYDFKLMFGFHAGMMLLMVFSHALPVQAVFSIVAFLFAALAGLSIRHRRRSDWRWPGVGPAGVLGAVFVLAAGVFFLGSVSPRFAPLSPVMLSWLAAGAGLMLFGVLVALKVVCTTKQEFQSQCGEPGKDGARSAAVSTEPTWKKVVRVGFSIVFLAVWVAGVSFFWKYHRAFDAGSQQPTLERTEPLTDHGRTVYVTPREQEEIGVLSAAMIIGVPSVLVLALLLHFAVGVKLFPNQPMLGRRRES